MKSLTNKQIEELVSILQQLTCHCADVKVGEGSIRVSIMRPNCPGCLAIAILRGLEEDRQRDNLITALLGAGARGHLVEEDYKLIKDIEENK